MSQVTQIASARGSLATNAIFLHGLGGDPRSTWTVGSDRSLIWPCWLAADIEGLAVWSVGYEAPVSRWRGTALHITDRATNILRLLLVTSDLEEGQVILIGHSLGGLVIKQMLRTGEVEARRDAAAASFMQRVRKVGFLATPHTGADLANWGDRLRILVR